MPVRRFLARAARFALGCVFSPRRMYARLVQFRMVARGRRIFAANGLDERFRGLMSEAFRPKYDDLVRLWDLVREKRPSLILEYGSGCSTLVMAAALLKNRQEGRGDGRLLSIEGYEKWRAHTESQLTEAEKTLVELREVQPQVATRALKINKDGTVVWYTIKEGFAVEQGIVGLVYPELHQLAPDMIYLDGPDPKSVPGYVDSKGVVFPAIVFDPLEMEEHLPPDATIVVDGRDSNTMVLYNNFRTPWTVKILGQQKCTVLRRTQAG